LRGEDEVKKMSQGLLLLSSRVLAERVLNQLDKCELCVKIQVEQKKNVQIED